MTIESVKEISDLLESKYITSESEEERLKESALLWKSVFNLSMYKIKMLERKSVDIK